MKLFHTVRVKCCLTKRPVNNTHIQHGWQKATIKNLSQHARSNDRWIDK